MQKQDQVYSQKKFSHGIKSALQLQPLTYGQLLDIFLATAVLYTFTEMLEVVSFFFLVKLLHQITHVSTHILTTELYSAFVASTKGWSYVTVCI